MNLKRINLTPYLLLLPSLIFLAFFFAWPMIQAFALAFQTADGQWTLAHIQRMVQDVAFTDALRTTLILIVAILPLQFTLALIMALLVQARLRGAGLFLYVFAIPLGISDLAAGITWFSIFTERGYLTSILHGLGLIDKPFIFLNYQTPGWLFLAVVLAEVWRATAIIMVILVAGLQSIPRDYLEAAEVFGAGLFDKVWRVILPLLRPSLQVALILRTILAFQVFAVVLALAGRGMSVLASEAYRWYNAYRNPNVAAAYAALIMLLSIVTTVLYLRALYTREEAMKL
jgi:multiple sugar transport system permease protein